MKTPYHIHDRRALVCPTHDSWPVTLDTPSRCPSDQHKDKCNGSALGFKCNKHMRDLSPAERQALEATVAKGNKVQALAAAATLAAGSILDPKPMVFAK